MKSFYKALLLKGKSVEWLAKKLDVTHQTVYAWKLGKVKPKVEHLKEISKLLNVPMETLINDYYL